MKKFILIAVLLLVGSSYGQNYGYTNSLVYRNVTGVNVPSAPANVSVARTNRLQNFNAPVGAVSYKALSGIKKTKKDHEIASIVDRANEASRKKIEVRKANTRALVKYNGKYSSIKLLDTDGKEVKADFNQDYKGLIVPRTRTEKSYFLEVKINDESKVFYHQVLL